MFFFIDIFAHSFLHNNANAENYSLPLWLCIFFLADCSLIQFRFGMHELFALNSICFFFISLLTVVLHKNKSFFLPMSYFKKKSFTIYSILLHQYTALLLYCTLHTSLLLQHYVPIS